MSYNWSLLFPVLCSDRPDRGCTGRPKGPSGFVSFLGGPSLAGALPSWIRTTQP
jgi:hypothetical protein